MKIATELQISKKQKKDRKKGGKKLDKILGATAWFCMASLFLSTVILGIRQMERDKKENNPFATIGFAFQLPALAMCVVFSLIFIFIGIALLTT